MKIKSALKLISLVLFLGLSACSSIAYKFPVDYGTTCYQNEEDEDSGRQICISAESDRDPTQWHFVKEWQQDGLPPMPDLP